MTLRSSIIYKYSCARCASGTYVGLTTRPLHMRIAEHQGISFRSKNPSQHPVSSAIREHSLKCSKQISSSEFSIIGQELPGNNLEILESLHIFHQKPTLNINQSSFQLKIIGQHGNNPRCCAYINTLAAIGLSLSAYILPRQLTLTYPRYPHAHASPPISSCKKYLINPRITLILCFFAEDGY